MRLLLLCLLLLAPAGHAVSLELTTPTSVPVDASSFDVHVRLSGLAPGPAEVKVWLGGEGWQASRTWGTSGWTRSDWYTQAVPEGHGGAWEDQVTLQANPDSRRFDQLTGHPRALVGVKVRQAGAVVAEHLTPVDLLNGTTHLIVHAAPGTPVRAGTGETWWQASMRGSQPGLLRLAVPSGAPVRLCLAARCPAPGSLAFLAAGATRAVLFNPGEEPVDLTGGVVLLPERTCQLTGTLAADAVLHVPSEPPGVGAQGKRAQGTARCIEESAGTDPRAVAYQAGNRVADVEVPGGGWRVREPGRGPWVPWVLPEGVLPAPVDPIHVEGWARPLATQENGLATVLELIAGARHRLTVATYMLTHPEIAEALIQAAQRGVEVRLFIEPEPIGGAPPGQRGLVAALLQAGVGVIEARGPWSATGVQHGKVVVADGHRCLVLTENLTRSGLPDPGRRGNLGFALAIANATLARELEARYGVHGPSHPGGIPTTWHPFAARVGIVTAPENAWSQAVVPRLLEEADGPVWGASLTTHPAWQDRSNPWLRALVNASDHVPVRVLLDGGGSHGPSSGTRLTLGHLARDPGAADLQVRLSGPAGKVHAKVLVTPGAVLVGSSNWNQGGALWNREVNLLVEDPSLAAWYAHALEEAFEEAGGAPEHLRVPGPSAGLVALGPCLAGWRLRRGPGLRPGS